MALLVARELVHRNERRDWDTKSDALAEMGLAASPASDFLSASVIGRIGKTGGRSKWRVDPFGAYVSSNPNPNPKENLSILYNNTDAAIFDSGDEPVYLFSREYFSVLLLLCILYKRPYAEAD
jgi:hypothetical protein